MVMELFSAFLLVAAGFTVGVAVGMLAATYWESFQVYLWSRDLDTPS